MRILYVSIIVILIDQMTKLTIRGFEIPWLGIKVEGMELGSSKQVIGDLLRITYTENPGMAFGLNFGDKFFLTIFTIAAAIGIFIYLYLVRNDGFLLKLALALILGGAIGNLIDRTFYGIIFGYAGIFHGRVVDFIDVDFFNINLFGYKIDRWPIFNIADTCVSIGVLILLFAHKKGEKTEGGENVDENRDENGKVSKN